MSLYSLLAESWSKPADNTLKVPLSWSAKTPAELLAQKPRICFDLDEGANIYDIMMAPGVGIPYAVFDNTRACCAVKRGGDRGRLQAVGQDGFGRARLWGLPWAGVCVGKQSHITSRQGM